MIRALLILYVLHFSLLTHGQELEKKFSDLFITSDLEGIVLGTEFMKVNGEKIFSFRGDERRIPASTFKPVTAGLLWLDKGKDFQWITDIFMKGQPDEQGVLNGDIIIKPSGDPSLASQYLETSSMDEIISDIFSSLRNNGVTCIKGQFILDVSFFNDNPVPGTWPREDAGNYYGGGFSPLNILDNSYRICFSGRDGVGVIPAILSVTPPLKDLQWDLKLTVAEKGTGDNAFIFGGPETDKKVIYGTIPEGKGEFCIKGSMPDPARFFMDTLTSFCQQNGIQNSGWIKGSNLDYNGTTRCWQHRSPELEKLVDQCLKRSLNHYADAFLFQIVSTSANDWHSATSEMSSRIAGITDGPETLLKDGSGMSPANGITPGQMTQLLAHFYNEMEDPMDYVRCFSQDRIDGGIYLKSGSLAGVTAYSGYIVKEGKTPISFSFMANQVGDDQKRKVRMKMLEFMRFLAERLTK